MTQFGYTMMTEQAAPDQLVRDVRLAEEAGFDFSVISDHFQPWLAEQGHSGYAWAILGAAAQATERIPLMTYVTCPILRYHPAIVAQKAATVQILSGNRFRLGLGSGENLNEHVVGRRWPAVGVRHEMLSEAIDIISTLFDGEDSANIRGKHFDIEQARLWDLPEQRVPIGVAVSGPASCRLAGTKADLMIAVEPKPESFEAVTQFVTPEQVADSLGCGPDVEEHVEKIKPFIEVGYTEVALVQIGDDTQEQFMHWAERELLPALRSLSPRASRSLQPRASRSAAPPANIRSCLRTPWRRSSTLTSTRSTPRSSSAMTLGCTAGR